MFGSLDLSLSPPGAGGAPTWAVEPTVAVDLDFANNLGFSSGAQSTAASFLTTVRSTVAWAPNVAGIWASFAIDTPRVTNLGLLSEQSVTSYALHNRDLTNAAWTKSNTTAAKDQTGVDGVANSASSLTATANAGTCLQAITSGSFARFQSAFVKRLVGSGAVEMTMDNGSTWTAVTVTTAWTRVSIPTQTLANPTVGFRLATNGDSIAVDFVQNESNTFVTSPIETTTTLVTRGADTISLTSTPSLGSAFSARVAATIPDVSATRYLLAGPTNNERILYVAGSNTTSSIFNGTSALLANAGSGGWQTGAKAASSVSGSGRAIALNNGTAATDANTQSFPSTLYFGRSGATIAGSFTISRATLWAYTLSSAQIKALTVL